MVAKRVLFPKAMPVSKKIRCMERQIYRNRPEMKSKTTSLTGSLAPGTVTVARPCQIASGTGVNERTGDKIRVWRVEVRGISDEHVDHYIIQCKTSSIPTYATFGSAQGAFIVDSENTNRFTEWVHYRNLNTSSNTCPIRFSKRFKGGILVKYNGQLATNIVDNEIVVVILNNIGTPRPDLSMSIRVWYTDA